MCILYKTEFNTKLFLYIFNSLIFLWLKRPMGRMGILASALGEKYAAYGQKMRPKCATVFSYQNWCLHNLGDFH